MATDIRPPLPLSFGLPALLWWGVVVIAFEGWSPTEDHCPRFFLGEDDRDRLSRLRSPVSRAEFIAGRAALHHAVRALGYDASAMRITYDPVSGKPYFDSPDTCLHFSITHTIGLACCIASRNCVVGCDCERWDRAVDREALSYLFGRRFATNKDCLVEWTKLEALMKLRGENLVEKLDCTSQLSSSPLVDNEDTNISRFTLDINREFIFSFCVEFRP